MPAPPAPETLWPRGRFKGLGVVKRHRVLMRAISETGYRLRDGSPKTRARQKLPAAIEAVLANDQVTRLIGRAEMALAGGAGPWPDEAAPSWIAIEDRPAMPLLRLGFRGALIRTVFHRESDDRGRVVKVEATESERLYSFDALKEAAEAARQALRAAGFPLSAYLSIEQLHGGQSGVATIGLRSLSPARARGPTMAR